MKRSQHECHFGDIDPATVSEYDVVVPLSPDALLTADKYRDRINQSIIAIPPGDVVRLLDDKPAFNARMKELGYGEYLPGEAGRGDYPYVVKKKHDFGGEHVFRIHDAADEVKYQQYLDSDEYFTQELLLDSVEQVTHMLMKENDLIFSFSLNYYFVDPDPVKGPEPNLYKEHFRCVHLPLFTKILQDLGFTGGICNFNYKLVDGVPKIFEINPRMGGSSRDLFCLYLKNAM